MIRLRLFEKIAATLKLAAPPARDVDVSQEELESRWDFPRPVLAASKARFFKRFQDEIMPAVEKELRDTYMREMPRGLIFHVPMKGLPDAAKQSLHEYKNRLKFFVVSGPGLKRLEKISSPKVQKVLSGLQSDLGGSISWSKVKESTNPEVHKKVSMLVNALLADAPDKAWEILEKEGGVSQADVERLTNILVESHMKEFAEDDTELRKRASAFVTRFMRRLVGKYGNAKNLINLGAVGTPQSLVDDVFTDVLMAFKDEVHRVAGVYKGDKSKGEASLAPIYKALSPSVLNHMFFIINNRVDDFVKPLLAKMRKPENSKLQDPQSDFLKAEDAFRTQESEHWAERVPDLRENAEQAMERIGEEEAAARDVRRLFQLLESLAKTSEQKQLAKSAQKAVEALPAVAAVLGHMEHLPAISQKVKDLQEKIKGVESAKEIRDRGWNFDLAFSLLDSTNTLVGSSQDLRNQFQRGSVAKALAAVLRPSGIKAEKFAQTFESPFFRNELPRLISKWEELEEAGINVAEEQFKEQKKRETIPQTQEKAEAEDEVEEAPAVRTSSFADDRVRTGSLWIDKLYRNFLKAR